MANTLKVIDMVTREALRIAHEKATFIGTIDRQYDSSFANTGAKIGETLRIRKPVQYNVRSGRVMDVQDSTETTTTLSVTNQKGVDIRFNSAELSLDVDVFSERFIKPAMTRLISEIEADVLQGCIKATPQVVGTPGTVPSDLSAWGDARSRINKQLAPKDDNRYIQADSATMSSMVNGLKGLFQDSGQIKSQYREGMMGRTSGFDWYENERCWTMPNSADVAGAINNGTLTSGITSLTVDGLTAAPVEGMVFTIADVYDVHPETKDAYSHLKQFVCASGCTTTNLDFTPAVIYSTTDATQNCSGTPVNDAAITFVGSASTSYLQNLAYHKEAFTFATADLPLYDDAEKCARREQDGISLRCWQGTDIRNDEMLMRLDILYGYKAIRPEWACRVTN